MHTHMHWHIRWQVTRAVFEWAAVILDRAQEGEGLDAECMQVMAELLRNSGALGDMQDSDTERGIYISAVDLIALGLGFAEAAAAASAEGGDAAGGGGGAAAAVLGELSLCVESCIDLVSLAIRKIGRVNHRAVCGSARGGEGGGADVDLRESVVSVLCEGWTSSPLAVRDGEVEAGGGRVRVLATLVQVCMCT